MELTKKRLLESGARSEYKPLTLDEINQFLDEEKEWDSKKVFRLIRMEVQLKEYEAQLMHSVKYRGVRKRLQKILVNA